MEIQFLTKTLDFVAMATVYIPENIQDMHSILKAITKYNEMVIWYDT